MKEEIWHWEKTLLCISSPDIPVRLAHRHRLFSTQTIGRRSSRTVLSRKSIGESIDSSILTSPPIQFSLFPWTAIFFLSLFPPEIFLPFLCSPCSILLLYSLFYSMGKKSYVGEKSRREEFHRGSKRESYVTVIILSIEKRERDLCDFCLPWEQWRCYHLPHRGGNR